MRKISLSVAALAALALVVPYAAPASAKETIIIKRGAGWHPHPHRVYNKVIIIKHGRRW